MRKAPNTVRVSSARSGPPTHLDPAPRGASKAAGENLSDILRNISSESHVRVSVNDLVAYEYVDHKTHGWRWGLGTVASLPAPRLVQLLLWSCGGDPSATAPPTAPVSAAERAFAARRLQELQQRKAETAAAAESLGQTLAVKQARYDAGREGYREELEEMEQTLKEVRSIVRSMEESDWREIRSYNHPPEIVKLVLEGTMLTLGERTLGWQDIRRVIRSKDFVKRVAEFDHARMSQQNRRLLQRYVQNARFNYEDAMNGSRALGVLQRWVTAQAGAARATAGLVDVDGQKLKDRVELHKMHDALHRFEDTLRAFDHEEDSLRQTLGEGAPLEVALGQGPTASASRGRSTERGTSPPSSARVTALPVRRQSVHGTARSWSLTDETIIVLRSSILVNYDVPRTTIITLTPAQVEQLKEALEARTASHAQEAEAAARRHRMQDEIEQLRGDLVELLQDRNALLAAQNDHENELRLKDRELQEVRQRAAADPDVNHNGDACSGASAALAVEAEAQELREQLRDATAEAAVHENGNGATADVNLLPAIAALEREMKILRGESERARGVVDELQTAIHMHPRLRAVFARVR